MLFPWLLSYNSPGPVYKIYELLPKQCPNAAEKRQNHLKQFIQNSGAGSVQLRRAQLKTLRRFS
jgi:hypothetical protein